MEVTILAGTACAACSACTVPHLELHPVRHKCPSCNKPVHGMQCGEPSGVDTIVGGTKCLKCHHALPSSDQTNNKKRSSDQNKKSTKRSKVERKSTPLAIPFAGLTFTDRNMFMVKDEVDEKASNEEDRGPFSVSTGFKLIDESTGDEHEIALPTLVDHLRQLCKNIGLKNTGSWSKFMCRQQIAQHIDNANVTESSNAKRNETRTNTNCRIVNAAFHPDIMEKLRCVKDAKKRSDQEGKTTFKDFW